MRSYITLATIRAERQADQESRMEGQSSRRAVLDWQRFLQAWREAETRARQGTITQVDEKPWEHEG